MPSNVLILIFIYLYIITVNGTSAKFCSGCGKCFGAEQYSSALGGAWHESCLVCDYCKQPFKAFKFVLRGERPYHAACIKQAFGRQCDACGHVLEGQCVKVEGKEYHRACFVCCICRVPLSGGFMEHEGRSYCVECAQSRL